MTPLTQDNPLPSWLAVTAEGVTVTLAYQANFNGVLVDKLTMRAPSVRDVEAAKGSLWSLCAMATTCRTSDGDLLDTICHNFYGHLVGSVEAVLAANQGLADEDQPYRAGVLIVLPDLPDPVEEQVTLWD